VFSLNDKDNDIFPCLRNIRLSYNIKNATVLCRSECTFLYKTINMVVILVGRYCYNVFIVKRLKCVFLK